MDTSQPPPPGKAPKTPKAPKAPKAPKTPAVALPAYVPWLLALSFLMAVVTLALVGYLVSRPSASGTGVQGDGALRMPSLSSQPADTSSQLYVVDGQLYYDGSLVSRVLQGEPNSTVRFDEDGKNLTVVAPTGPSMAYPVPLVAPGFSSSQTSP